MVLYYHAKAFEEPFYEKEQQDYAGGDAGFSV